MRPAEASGSIDGSALLCNQLAVRVQGRQQTFTTSPATRLIVAGVVSEGGRRKIDEIINPRLQRLEGFGDGISPAKAQFIFRPTIEEMLAELGKNVAAEVGFNPT